MDMEYKKGQTTPSNIFYLIKSFFPETNFLCKISRRQGLENTNYMYIQKVLEFEGICSLDAKYIIQDANFRGKTFF